MTQTHYIGGEWQAGQGQPLQSVNPSNGNPVWQGKTASPEQVQEAIAHARAAFEPWSFKAVAERQAIIETFGQLLDKNRQQLTDIIAQETGKVRWDAQGELNAMIGKIAISCQAYQERTGQHQQNQAAGMSRLNHRPHGVVAVFGPYNFPGHLPNGHIVPALLAGNTLVFKPSEQTPWTAEFMVQLWQQAGLPKGVINLVQGELATSQALAAGDIDGLFFTGSVKTGQILHRQLAGQPEKILALELGGNNPLIIHPTADRQAAVYHILQSAYLTTGQRCTCARRLLLPQGDGGDQLLAQLKKAVAQLTYGAWDEDPQPFMGSMISEQAADQMVIAQQQLVDLGGQVLVELKKIRDGSGFVSPGLVEVSAIGDLPDEEYFGPLLQVMRYKDFDHAITLANQTRFGLAAALLGGQTEDFDYFSQRIRAGVVNWNRPTNGASSAAPFGGIGLSGNHRPSAYYAADYCAWPMASMLDENLTLPATLSPGIHL